MHTMDSLSLNIHLSYWTKREQTVLDTDPHTRWVWFAGRRFSELGRGVRSRFPTCTSGPANPTREEKRDRQNNWTATRGIWSACTLSRWEYRPSTQQSIWDSVNTAGLPPPDVAHVGEAEWNGWWLVLRLQMLAILLSVCVHVYLAILKSQSVSQSVRPPWSSRGPSG